MSRFLKLCLFTLAVSGLALLGPTGETGVDRTASAQAQAQLVAINSLPAPLTGLVRGRVHPMSTVGHGTHLCSADEHCGTGHKCCSGHCKAVATC